MALPAGARLGPYEVSGLIGSGGMGEVYKARDTRLGRTVALKVLPPGAADQERRRRFEQEARAVSALNHPHICTLHDVGRDGETDYLVMEFVEGETLAARLTRGAIPRREAIELATQIAQALSAAHTAGIVHRDLKPGNIMLTEAGVKVFDFGLARLNPAAAPEGLSSLPTQESPISRQGTVLGTLAYMAPEQLEGKPVDTRTDLFAFGAVFYEMLTGSRAFGGTTQASVITAIMSAEPPPLASFEPLTPPALDRVVRKCLAKDPRARWQTAADLADELKWISSDLEPAGAGAPRGADSGSARTRASRRELGWWGLAGGAGLVVVAGAAAAWWWTTREPRMTGPPQQVRETRLTFSGDVRVVSLSRDGATVAYATSTQDSARVMVRDIAGGEPVEVWHGRGVNDCVWMPNGRQLVLSVSGSGGESEVIVIPKAGGPPRPIAGLNVRTLTISPDGKHLAGATRSPELYLTETGGGPVRRVSLAGLLEFYRVAWSPAGERIAISGATPNLESGVWTIKPDGSDLRRIHGSGSMFLAGGAPLEISWSRSGDAVYVSQMTLEGAREVWRVPDMASGTPAGAATRASQAPFECMSMSADGARAAQVRTAMVANLWRLDLTTTGAEPTPLTRTASALLFPRVSPDGRTVAATRGNEIVRIPIGGGEPVVMLRGVGGAWSPDGRRFAFAADRGQGRRLFVGDADGQNAREIPDAIPALQILWVPDGRLAWQLGGAPQPMHNYGVLDLLTGDRDLVVKNPSGILLQASFSPRSDRVALMVIDMDENVGGLRVVPLSGRKQSRSGDFFWPVGWSPDGRWIYAYKPDGGFFRVAENGSVEALGRLPRGYYGLLACDLTPDRRAAICSVEDSKTDVWIIDHFGGTP